MNWSWVREFDRLYYLIDSSWCIDNIVKILLLIIKKIRVVIFSYLKLLLK